MTAGQNLNPIKSAAAAPSTDNEAAMRDFQTAVSNVPISSRPSSADFLRMIQLSVQEDRGIIPRALRICK
jgi:hypothetical protein